jgi:hypothetical protein
MIRLIFECRLLLPSSYCNVAFEPTTGLVQTLVYDLPLGCTVVDIQAFDLCRTPNDHIKMTRKISVN